MGQLLQRMEQLQAKESSVFPKGSFPSYRLYALNKDREKADVNGFFTGLVAFTLNDLKPQLTRHQQQLATEITKLHYRYFQNFKTGRAATPIISGPPIHRRSFPMRAG
jgi:hypothetical protein